MQAEAEWSFYCFFLHKLWFFDKWVLFNSVEAPVVEAPTMYLFTV